MVDLACCFFRVRLLFCFVLGCFAVPPQLVDQKLWFVNETLLNVDYEVAVVQMEFDQDLYLSGESFVCAEAEKDCPDIDCIPCDWSSQQVICFFHFLFSKLSVCSFFFDVFLMFSCLIFVVFLVPDRNILAKLRALFLLFSCLFPSLVPPPPPLLSN